MRAALANVLFTRPRSPLLTSLVSYWKLEEASGTRADSHGSNSLADINTATQAAGKVGNAGQFTRANKECLTIADNASISTGDIDFTFAAWVYMDSAPAEPMQIVCQWVGGSRGYLLQWNNPSSRFQFLVYNSAGSIVGTVTAGTFGAPSLATWMHIIAWHDSVNDQVGIAVNAGTADTASTTGTPNDSTATFTAGGIKDVDAQYWDGRLDEIGFWKRVLTAAERTQLYNAGAGLAYPFA